MLLEDAPPPTAEVATARVRRTLPDARVGIAQTRTRTPRHGRTETRTLVALASADLNAYVGSAGTVGRPWPGVAQVLRLQRVVARPARATSPARTTTEVAWAITSLPPERASAADLLRRWRTHWHIENRLHWVRDVTLGEDASPIHLGQAPLVVALLRTAVLELLRYVDAPSLAAAQRDLALRPDAALGLFRDLAHARARRAPAAPVPRRLSPSAAPPPTTHAKAS